MFLYDNVIVIIHIYVILILQYDYYFYINIKKISYQRIKRRKEIVKRKGFKYMNTVFVKTVLYICKKIVPLFFWDINESIFATKIKIVFKINWEINIIDIDILDISLLNYTNY